ncbi:MAG: 50S ribosomal protein L10 [bacterium]
MPIQRAKKEEIVSKVKDIIDSSNSMVFVNFHKLPVTQTGEVRRELRSHELGYYVAKKTLVKKALSDAGIKGELPPLEGELALVYGTDLLAPAREIFAFQKKMDKKISIMGGVFEGVYKSKEEMESIASIPSRDGLLSMFLNVINSPIQGFVVALNAIADKIDSK